MVNPTGGVISALDMTASEAGYRRLLALANRQAVGRRAWAVEGTGSYGSGLAVFLEEHGERVLEIERPRRPRQKPAKSDQLDAIAAAREALAVDRPCLACEERRRFEFCWQPWKEPSRHASRHFASCTRWSSAHRRRFVAASGDWLLRRW